MDPEHTAIGGAEDFPNPLAETGRVAAEIDGNVEDFSVKASNELSLRLTDLVMQTTYYVLAGIGLVVLHEGTHDPEFSKNPFVKALEKHAPIVFKDPGFQELHIRNTGRY
jgi:hypothetical protein